MLAVRASAGNRRPSAARIPMSLTMRVRIPRSRSGGMRSNRRARSCGLGMMLRASWSSRPVEATRRWQATSSSQV